MKKDLEIVDMFCGAGGESTGIMQAVREKEMNVHMLAINHWERAIETHAANHPEADHLCESVEHIDPTKAVPGGRVALLWASPECTHHSIARGGRPRSDQSRASAWLILKWLSELYVERVIIENVPEFTSWGRLDANGQPIQSEKGRIFKAFVHSLRALGYSVDWRVLTAADYGDPTTRHRLFIQAVKGRKRIIWPEITNIDGGNNLLGLKPWVPARNIIDWSIPGTSIFTRKKPLAAATVRRIAAGIEKYWTPYAKPFLAVLYGSNDVRSLDLPLPTVTTSGNHHALITPFITRYNGSHRDETDGDNRNQSLGKPISTLDTSNRFGLVEPFITCIGQSSGGNRIHSIDEPITTVVTKQEHCLVEPMLVEYSGNGSTVPVTEPVPTISTKQHFALLEGHAGAKLDIRFRMLKPHELARAQGFPEDYRILGNITEQTKQIGNAVPVHTARALTLATIGA
jgi:DNA (cytosine-5)-methyltransferase 1